MDNIYVTNKITIMLNKINILSLSARVSGITINYKILTKQCIYFYNVNTKSNG